MSNFDRQMKKLTKDVNTVGNKLKSTGAALSTAITLPVAAIGAASIKTGMDFESSMSKVAAISGATGDELTALEEKARELGATTAFSASEAADGMSFLAMAGYDANQVLSAMPGLLDLAAAGQLDLARAADITTNIMSGFNMEADKTQQVADMLAAAAASANTDVEQLGSAMSYVAPVAAGAGIKIEETAAAIGILSNAGIQGERAGTALRGMIASLQNPTGQTAKALEDLGLSAEDVNPSMHSLSDILKTLEEAGIDSSQAMQLVGVEAGPALLAMLTQGSTGLTAYTAELANSEGAANKMATTMQDNLGGRIKELQSAFEEVAITIYENLQPALETLVGAVKGIADWFNSLSPSTQNLIVGLAGLAAVIGPLLTAVGIAIILFGQLSAALSILGISMSVAMWWVFAIIAALAGIVAVVVYWDEIKAYFIKFWAFLKAAFQAALNVLKKNVTTTWNAIKSVTSSVWNTLKSITSATWTGLKNMIMTPVNYIRSAVGSAFTGMVSTALGAWNGLKSGMKSVINGIIRMVNVFIRGFNTPAKLLSKLPGVSVPSIPTIPMLATGGNVFGSGAFITGEAGPELVQKSGSSVKVTPLSSQEKANGVGGALGGKTTIEVPLYLDGHEIARATYGYMDKIQGSMMGSKMRLSGVKG